AVLLSPERYALAGVPVFVFEAGDQPVLKVEWVFQAGKTREDAPGAAFLTAQLMKGGTESHTAQVIAEKLASYGASLVVAPHLDYTSFTLTTLTKFAEELIPWVTSLFWGATFPEEEVERQRAKKEQAIRIDLEKTSYLATVELRKAVFGAKHMYGQPLDLEGVQALTRNDVKHHHEHYHRNGLQVFISGRVSPSHLKALEAALMSGPEGVVKEVAELLPPTAGAKLNFPKEGVQSTLRIGQQVLPKGHPDFHQFRIAVELLGGYFGARLMQNLREDKGLTYGIYSQIMPLAQGNYLSIGADVKKADVDLALAEVEKEVRLLGTERVSEEELGRVKTQLAGKLLGQMNSPFAHAEVFKGLYYWDLPMSRFRDFFTAIEATTPEVIQKMATTYLKWEDLHAVVVG
ncbi:MAG TPA: hypothetical protein DCE41_14125, partial [Cytophagales bacterium]|nr:hypothetical protein [Cytophagales bacterium]